MSDKIGEFLQQHDWELHRRVKGWDVERDSDNPDVVRLTLPARDKDRYIVRCLCDGYPEQPPSVKFINKDGSASDRTAWPAGNQRFYEVVKLPPESFLCTDITREGLAHHPEWRGGASAWDGKKHTLMTIFNYLHDELLNSNDYTKRA